MPLCTDADLLYCEPSLFVDASGVAQSVLAGLASIDQSTVHVGDLHLAEAGVAPGQVITFLGPDLRGSFPILSLSSTSTLQISILHDGLEASAPAPIQPASAADQNFVIRTFYPQRHWTTQEILETAGLDPDVAASLPRILNPQVLRRPCALGAIQMIFNARASVAVSSAAQSLAGLSDNAYAAGYAAAHDREPNQYAARALAYDRLYRRALRSVRVLIDTDDDGQPNLARYLSTLNLQRA